MAGTTIKTVTVEKALEKLADLAAFYEREADRFADKWDASGHDATDPESLRASYRLEWYRAQAHATRLSISEMRSMLNL